MPDHDVRDTSRRVSAVAVLALLVSLGAVPAMAGAQVASTAADSVRTITLDDAFRLAEASSPDVAIASAGITRA